MRYLSVLFLVLVVFLTGCGGGNNTDSGSSYYVTVKVQAMDHETSLPISNATTIIENGPTGSTSGSGLTSFSNIEGNKDYTFVTSAPNYGTNRSTQHIGAQNITLTVYLSKQLGSVIGTVTDEISTPMTASVRLVELNQSTSTDPSTGAFSFANVPLSDDPYSVEISKTGYATRTIGNLKLTPQNLTANTGPIILSNNPGTIQGRVTDPDGLVISNALVLVVETNQTTYTDVNGQYTIEVLPGTYSMTSSESHYGSAQKTGVQVHSQSITTANFQLTLKPGSIFGVVRNSIGSPVPGSTATVVGTGLSAISGVDGSFRVSNVTPGTFTVTVSNPLYNSQSVSATVLSNQETSLGDITLVSKLGKITGYVSSAGCTVTLFSPTVSPGQTYGAASNFSFDNVAPGPFVLRIEKANYKTTFVTGTLGSSETKDVGTVNCPTVISGYPWGAETSNGTANTTTGKTANFVINCPQNISIGWNGFDTVKIYTSSGSLVWSNSSINGNTTVYLAPGTYYAHSDWGTEVINVSYVTDTKSPQIDSISPVWGSGSSGYSITIHAADTYLSSLQYVFSGINDPGSGYQNLANGASAVINTQGTWYLHVKATDYAGFSTYRVEGPFIIP